METAGYFARLSVGLNAIGVRTLYADLEGHPFSYSEAPRPTLLVRLVRFVTTRLAATPTGPGRTAWKAGSLAARGLLLARAIASCDLFVFGSGQTLFGGRELRLLRLLGKRVVIVFFGTDVRPSYLDGVEAGSPNATSEQLVAWTRAKRERIRRVERHATAIVSHGPNSQLLSREFAEWLAIGIPTTLQPEAEERTTGPVRVLHAPSHAGVKGTGEIRAAVERLRRSGVPIDYRELQNASNAAVAASIAEADLVVDQLYSDTPMAVLATEAAAAGRPTMVGAIDWDSILETAPPSLPPTIRCEPAAFESELRRVVESPPRRLEIGRRARQFVRERWTPQAVARRYLALADGTAPPEWFRPPASIAYASGAGLPRERLRELLAGVAEMGDDPFAVSDKPELERRLRRIAAGDAAATHARHARTGG